MERFCLKSLSAEGFCGGLITGDPGRYVKEGSGYRHLSLYRGPFMSEENLESEGGEGLYTGNFE
jgi:hypothetical protein